MTVLICSFVGSAGASCPVACRTMLAAATFSSSCLIRFGIFHGTHIDAL